MKKLFLATIYISSLTFVTQAQVQPCGMYDMIEYNKQTIPGYADMLKENEQKIANELKLIEQRNSSSLLKTASVAQVNYTIPVVFHVLHTGSKVTKAQCQALIDRLNQDYLKKTIDTNKMDPYFNKLYINSNIIFKLAQKDPAGRCTDGVIYHYDPNTIWNQNNATYNYKYSNPAIPGFWHPNKYLNIYVVKEIVAPNNKGTILGYTYKPGQSPSKSADAVVCLAQEVNGISRTMSHEIGHWLSLGHTFGDNNAPNPILCGNDDVDDTPRTTGFFSTCPKLSYIFPVVPNVDIKNDELEITGFNLAATNSQTNGAGAYSSKTDINSLNTATISVSYSNSPALANKTVNVRGIAGAYSNFMETYPVEINVSIFKTAQTNFTLTANQGVGKPNFAKIFIDYDNDGTFENPTDLAFASPPTTTLLGTQTFTGSFNTPAKGQFLKMRVIISNSVILTSTTDINSGEIEDYILTAGLRSCDSIRPNIENIMDYAECPINFTKGQTNKMRTALEIVTTGRKNIVSMNNLFQTGLLNRTYQSHIGTDTTWNYSPATVVAACAPTSDFYANKTTYCMGQTVNYLSDVSGGTATTYTWNFPAGTPSISNLQNVSVTYNAPGLYSASLTVANSSGNHTTSKTQYVNIDQASWYTPSIPYNQGFENGLDGWNIRNKESGSIEWKLSNYGSKNSSKSMVLEGYNPTGMQNTEDVIESPKYNFKYISNIGITVDYYAPKKGTNAATALSATTLKLEFSRDCAGSWQAFPVNFPAELTMGNTFGYINSGPAIPFNASDWRTLTVGNAGFVENQENVILRIWSTINPLTGQNVYIDNINITGVVSLGELSEALKFNMYPNPTQNQSIIEFTSPLNRTATILVHDVVGRIIENTTLQANAGVKVSHTINQNNMMQAGVYFVTISIGQEKMVRKLIIQ